MSSPFIRDPNRLRFAQAVVNEAVQSGGYASLALAVANRSTMLWQQQLSAAESVAHNSIFAIASISKPVTVTALMQLVDRGRLVLRDPVADYIPEFGQHGKERVTLWHLITHTSGVQQPSGDQDMALEAQRAPLSAYLAYAYKRGLDFEPGSQWAYTQVTYSILGEIIARVSGQPHPAFMHEHLFTPLGMVDTAFAPTDPTRLVNQFGNQRTPEARTYRDSLAFPAFGLYSTVDDLVAFGQAFLNRGTHGAIRVLSDGAVEAMTRVQTTGIPTIENGRPIPTFQGLGWGVRSPYGNILGSEQAYGHAGGGGSYLWVDPVWDLVFVLLSNSVAPHANLATRLLNSVYGAFERT